jgi:AcrR family transcriptional regulator
MAGDETAVKIRAPGVRRTADPAGAPRLAALIGAAETIFLEKGYHAATMSDVARAAGMSKKTVYTMIESKSELFGALLAHHNALLKFPEPQPHWTAREALVAHLLALGRFLLSPGQIAIIRLIMAEYTHSPELGHIFVQSRLVKAKAKLDHCLAELTRQHGRPAGDVKEMAAMLFGMTIGEFHLRVLIGYRAAPSRPALEKRVRRAVDIFLGGLGIAP